MCKNVCNVIWQKLAQIMNRSRPDILCWTSVFLCTLLYNMYVYKKQEKRERVAWAGQRQLSLHEVKAWTYSQAGAD